MSCPATSCGFAGAGVRLDPDGAPPLVVWLRAGILLALVGLALAALLFSGADLGDLLV